MIVNDPRESALLEKKGILFAVADGLGGMEHGEMASAAAILHLDHLFKDLEELKEPDWLRQAVGAVNQKIYQINKGLDSSEWMGTTLTASIFFKDELVTAHVGDSRMYQVRDGRICCLTTDHSVDRYTLTRVIGVGPDVAVDLYRMPLKKGDTYLQCSDGLYSMVSDDELLRGVSSSSVKEGCQRLVAMANENGGADNITLQLVRVEE